MSANKYTVFSDLGKILGEVEARDGVAAWNRAIDLHGERIGAVSSDHARLVARVEELEGALELCSQKLVLAAGLARKRGRPATAAEFDTAAQRARQALTRARPPAPRRRSRAPRHRSRSLLEELVVLPCWSD